MPTLRRDATLLLAVALLPVLVSCGGGDGAGDSAWTTVVEDDSGVRTVQNRPPVAPDQPTKVADEEVRIGSFDGSGPSSFGFVRAIDVLPGGRIAVADAQAEEVRLFSPEGKFIRTFGGEGEGPGSLRGLQGIYVRDGELWVPEQGNARVSVFDPDSGFVRSYPFRFWSFGSRGPWPAVVDTAGRTVVNSSGQFGEGRSWSMLRVYGEDLVQVDSFPYFDYTDEIQSDEQPGAWKVELGEGRWSWAPVPFYAPAYEALTRSGDLLRSTEGAAQLEVTRLSPPADTTLVFSSLRPPEAVSGAERHSAMSELGDMFEERTGVTPGFDPSRVPATKPPLHGLSTDDASRIWVRLSAPDIQPTRYDVFSPDGVHAETVHFPFKVDPWVPPLVRGDQFWAVVADEMDVQYVVSGRLRSVRRTEQ